MSYYFGRIPFDPSICNGTLSHSMRELWAGHVNFERNYLIAAVNGTPDAPVAQQRLFQNSYNIGLAFGRFFGKDAGDYMNDLLVSHVQMFVNLIDAMKKNNKRAAENLSNNWFWNARQIAEFWTQINPKYWWFRKTDKMMKQHLHWTLQEMTARMRKDWVGDIEAYDSAMNQILMMADVLSDGVIRRRNDRGRVITT